MALRTPGIRPGDANSTGVVTPAVYMYGVRDGADRVDVAYAWPTTLRLPRRPPMLVYLDLNHWVQLAKAKAGHRDGADHRDVLDACIDAQRSGTATFPISDTIYTEVSKIGQYRQRRDLREVIETLSRYAVVTSRPAIATHEIEAVLDAAIGPNPQPINDMDYLDWGVARAFGMAGGFRVRNSAHEDVTEEVRTSWAGGADAFDEMCATAELELQRRTLDGPSPSEEPELRSLGWNPASTIRVAQNRARQEVEQVERFNSDPRWRAGRIRDVVAAREVLIEINEMLCRGLDERDAALDDIFGPPDRTRHQLDAMPSFDVAVTLKTAYHRDPNHHWTPNDVHDIDALGSTVPYCDVVITDRSAAAHVNSSGLAERLGTIVIAKLTDLKSYI